MERTTNKFILFFKDKEFRSNTFKYLKFRFCLLPGVRNIISWWVGFKFAMKTKDMSSWDQHVAKMNFERSARRTTFVCALIRLYACITAQDEYRNDEDFLANKRDVLECEYWKDVPELSEFKSWIESVTPEERNSEIIKNVLEKYTKPE